MKPQLVVPMHGDDEDGEPYRPLRFYLDNDGDVCIFDEDDVESNEPWTYRFDAPTWDTICTFVASQRVFQ